MDCGVPAITADPAIVGKTIKVDSEDFTVIGVMPPEFEFQFFSPSGNYGCRLLTPRAIRTRLAFFLLPRAAETRCDDGTGARTDEHHRAEPCPAISPRQCREERDH